MVGQLVEYADVPQPAAGLHLSPAECRAIEELTGLGTTRSPLELQRAIDRLGSIRVGDVRLPFTPGQLAEIAHRAGKRGRSVEEEMKAAVDRIADDIFHRGG